MKDIEITQLAEDSLKKIYCRYPDETAQRIIENILQKIDSLSALTDRGRIVEELKMLNQNHRFILEGSYKIIYFHKDDTVYVTDVFDTLRNPDLIVKRYREQ
ncbi:MAG: type II toxin-antitoxin system RelE/ParE family toxin [Marinoscillum sp.]